MIQPAPIIFVRHGTTDWNFDSLSLGILDLPLNAKGVNEVEITAQKLKDIQNSIIISSPKKRTLETAAIISKRVNCQFLVEVALNARYYGDFSEDIDACEKFQTALKENVDDDQLELLLPKDAEKIDIFNDRIVNVFKKIISEFSNKTIIIVSHGEVYRSLCRSLVQDEKMQIAKGDMRAFHPPTSILDNLEIQFDKGSWLVSGAGHRL